MKVRKKPIVVTATKFDRKKAETNFAADYPMVMDMAVFTTAVGTLESKDRFYIDTLEGPLIVRDGWYIIEGIAGEHYACEPDIFEQTYEIVD